MLARVHGSTPGMRVGVDRSKGIRLLRHAELNARRPRQPLSTDDMDVEVVDGLQALLAVVDDTAVTLGAVPAADVGGDEEQVPEHLLRTSRLVMKY